jgi:hypothetical protein
VAKARGYLAMLRILTHVVSSFVECPLMAHRVISLRRKICRLLD